MSNFKQHHIGSNSISVSSIEYDYLPDDHYSSHYTMTPPLYKQQEIPSYSPQIHQLRSSTNIKKEIDTINLRKVIQKATVFALSCTEMYQTKKFQKQPTSTQSSPNIGINEDIPPYLAYAEMKMLSSLSPSSPKELQQQPSDRSSKLPQKRQVNKLHNLNERYGNRSNRGQPLSSPRGDQNSGLNHSRSSKKSFEPEHSQFNLQDIKEDFTLYEARPISERSYTQAPYKFLYDDYYETASPYTCRNETTSTIRIDVGFEEKPSSKKSFRSKKTPKNRILSNLLSRKR